METINDRMEMLVNECFGGNKAAFAQHIGYPGTSMSSYLGNKRRSKPSVEMVVKIITTMDVDARWLLTGEETVRKEEYKAETNGPMSPATAKGDIHMPALYPAQGTVVPKSDDEQATNQFAPNTEGDSVPVLKERIRGLQALLEAKDQTIALLEKGSKP